MDEARPLKTNTMKTAYSLNNGKGPGCFFKSLESQLATLKFMCNS